MDLSSAKSERVTAIISTVVAVIILAAGVTAHQSRNAPVDQVTQLESDLRFQLDVGFRHDANEQQARLAKLEQVLAAWQQSAQQKSNRQLLADWLLEATICCMPGSIEPLPAAPSFADQRQASTSQPEQTLDVLTPLPELTHPAPNSTEARVPTPAETSPPTDNDPIADQNSEEPVFTTVAVSVEAPRRAASQTEQSLLTPTQNSPDPLEPVRINLTELRARIAGYHEALDEVETALLTLDSNDLEPLGQQVRQLSDITRHFQFVHMYYDALNQRERASITKPRSMQATLAEISRRLDRNEQAIQEDFLGEFDLNHQQLLKDLRQQLNHVAKHIQW